MKNIFKKTLAEVGIEPGAIGWDAVTLTIRLTDYCRDSVEVVPYKGIAWRRRGRDCRYKLPPTS